MIIQVEQQSEEWINLRKTKITATDSASILGRNPYCSKEQLIQKKKGLIEETINDAMREGNKLEPIARNIYEKKYKRNMAPTVHICDSHTWAMCSTDGLSEDGKLLLEIKCGRYAFYKAYKGEILEYYLSQIQHCLWVTGAQVCHYMAFNGVLDIYMQVERNEVFIADMIKKEYEFYMEYIYESADKDL